MREKGIVREFERGYGWIRPSAGGSAIFVHYNNIDMRGFKKLEAGDVVEYFTEHGERGHYAANVKLIQSAEAA